MWRKSLRRRFFLTLVAPVLLTLTVMSAAGFYSAWHEVQEIYDAQLAQTAEVMNSLLHQEIDDGDIEELRDYFEHSHHAYETHIALRVWKGHRLFFGSQNAQELGPPSETAGFSNKKLGNKWWRFFVLPDNGTGLTVEVAQDYYVRMDIIEKILFSMFSPILALFGVLPLLFWLGLKFGLEPLRRVSEQVARRSPDDLARISIEHAPSEITPLMESLNRLLGQLERALTTERRLTDLAAHELRTPLAVIKTQVQAALRANNNEERQKILRDLDIAATRSAEMVSQLLALARLGQENIVMTPVAIDKVVREVMKALVPITLKKNITLALEADSVPEVKGNEEIIALAFRNLLDNAIKYTPQNGQVTVSLRASPHAVRLAVADSGPGVPEEKLAHLTERFYRVPGNRETGSGLGLTIVTRVAALLGAKFHIQNRQSAAGLEVSLEFPAD